MNRCIVDLSVEILSLMMSKSKNTLVIFHDFLLTMCNVLLVIVGAYEGLCDLLS